MTKSGTASAARGLLSVAVLAVLASTAMGQMRITEYMYSGSGEEYVEFTNVGTSAIDMTGWSYDDSSQIPGTLDLSAFGSVAAGESVIITEDTAANFRLAWGLAGTVKVIGEYSNNLGRNDEINLYDASDALVDQLTYGDEDFPGSIRTQGASGWVCTEALGTNDPFSWFLSSVGDVQNSYASTAGDVGNPGTHVFFTCPTQQIGACCLGGNCLFTDTESACAQAGGLYQGDGTDCNTYTCPQPSNAIVRITEYMYKGDSGEFVELTNLDTVAVDLTGWSFDDDSAVPGTFDLSGLGTIAPGESVIFTEIEAADFIMDWGISGVTVLGNSAPGLGGDDVINIFDASGTVVDQLAYGDGTFPGSIVTDNISGWVCQDGIGANDIFQWQLSSVGDAQGSFASPLWPNMIGNPGSFVVYDCPDVQGACCIDGACSVMSEVDCQLAHGTYQGDNTDCTGGCPAAETSNVVITEYMYSGNGDEFFELTNLGPDPVDFTGWGFTDEANLGAQYPLSDLGVVAVGESVIVTEAADAATFRTDWGLDPSVKIQPTGAGLFGRADTYYIYDTSGTVVDMLQYDDETFAGTIRTKDVSGWPCAASVGVNDIYGWVLSEVGDSQGSTTSSLGDIGSPGAFTLDNCVEPVPTMTEWGVITIGVLLMVGGGVVIRRRQQAAA